VSAPGKRRPPYLGPERGPAVLRALGWANRALAIVEGAGIAFTLSALILLASWQFLARNLRGLHVPPAPDWINSVIRYSVFFIGFFGAAFATHVIKHLRVDALTRLLPVRLRLAVRIVTTIFAIVVCWHLVRAGWAYHRDIVQNEAGDFAQAQELINAERGSLALPIGFSLMMIHFAVQILLDLAWVVSGQTPPPEWLAEAHGGEIEAGDRGEALETATVASEDL
jgi:TRAP-type C4-dicarboxylate transport system permease small subunit